MKITFEIPDALLLQAKAVAAERGIPLQEFVTQAVRERLGAQGADGGKPWMARFGKLKNLRQETKRINDIIDAEFEKIDAEDKPNL